MPTVSVFSGSSVSYSTGDAHVQEINIHGVSYSTGDEDSSFRLGGRSLPRVEILEIELDSPSYSRRSSTPDFLRRRLPSPTRFVYGNRSPSSSPTRGRSPSPLTHGFGAAIGNALSDHLSSSSRRRSPSPTIHYHRSQGLLDRAGSIFNSRPSSSSGTRSRAGSTSMRSTYDSDRGTQQGTQFRYHSRAPTSSSSSGDYGSTYSCHRGTGRRGSSAAPSSSAYGSPYASGQSAPKASSNFHSSSGYSHSYQSGRSTPKTTSQSRSSSASTSRHDSENYSRSSRATNSSHYFVPGDKSSSPSRSHSTSRDSRSKDSHSTSSRSHSTAKETRSKDSHATSSRSHSRTDSHSSSSRSTARPTSRTDSCSTSGTSRHHSSRDTFKTYARSTTASSRFASNLKTTTNGPQHTQSQLAAIFKSYDAKWSNLGRTDKKYPIPASTSDLFKLDFSGAWQARNRNWSNEAVFVANVQLVYLAGFGIAATLNDRGDTLSVDYNRDGTSSKLQSLAKWLGRVEIPRFHPDRMNLRTGVEGKVDQSISKKMEVVAMRTAAQTLLELVN